MDFTSSYFKILLILLLIQQISALATISVVEDLLGPGQCPIRSSCIDTSHCLDQYYTTKSGLPFYCGPHHQIDSMICCVSMISEEIVPEVLDRTIRGQPEFNEAESESNRLSEDDGELDILTMPFPKIQVSDDPFEFHLPDSDAELKGRNTFDNFESLPEDTIEPDLNSIRQSMPIITSANKNLPLPLSTNTVNTPDNELVENESLLDAPEQSEVVNARTSQSLPPSHLSGEDSSNIHINPRAPNENQRLYACSCEKGERGEVGRKGDPGEPGKIIYIPVFVNGAGHPSAFQGTGGMALSTPPQLTPSPLGQPNQYAYGQNSPVPHHPSPTVVAYNVPVPTTTASYISQPQFQIPPSPVHQSEYSIQQPPVVGSQPIQQPTYPYTEQPRSTRHAAAISNHIRKRY